VLFGGSGSVGILGRPLAGHLARLETWGCHHSLLPGGCKCGVVGAVKGLQQGWAQADWANATELCRGGARALAFDAMRSRDA
jgi:hypothetical protein